MGTHQDKQLRLHAFLTRSYTTGPGCRAALWLQGRMAEEHDYAKRDAFSPRGEQSLLVAYLVRHIVALEDDLEGITLLGSEHSEPFDQYDALLWLIQRIKAETSLSVVLFTNLTLNELYQQGYAAILATIDVLFAQYTTEKPPDQLVQTTAHHIPTIPNKNLYLLTNRYTLADMHAVPDAEVIITRDGNVISSGNTPVQL